jgi:hypothetical protein
MGKGLLAVMDVAAPSWGVPAPLDFVLAVDPVPTQCIKF